MKIINHKLLSETSKKARLNKRKRINHNFHDEMENPVHRLLNALEPETYIRPHRHTNPAKEESIIVLSGELLFFSFYEDGKVKDCLNMGPNTETVGVDLKAGEWHMLIPLIENTVIYEVKPGPFDPLAPEDFASWAPDGSNIDDANNYKEMLINYFATNTK